MPLPKEIDKIYKRIDKIAKGGKENFLQYYLLIDEYVRKKNWDLFKQCLYFSYGIQADDVSISDIKKETWPKILFNTNKNLQDSKYSLFKSNGIYSQGVNYYLEGSNPVRKLGEIREISKSSDPNNYQSHRNSNILDKNKISLEVIPSQELKIDKLIDSFEYVDFPLDDDYLNDRNNRERIQSGLTSLGVDRDIIFNIINSSQRTLSFLSANGGNSYRSIIDQKLEIDFNFDVLPSGGTGSFFVSIFNYNKCDSRFVQFSVGSQSQSEYFFTNGVTFSVSGSKEIDINSNEIVGISIYKDSISDIRFDISNTLINFNCVYIKESPQFLINEDINWLKNNNSVKTYLSDDFISMTASQKSQSKVIFSNWDIEKSYDKNVMNLYKESIDFLL